MPFRQTFDCLWCGQSHTVRTPDDLEGWAHLCPACVGRAGENGFIRFRVREALTERGAARGTRPAMPHPTPAPIPASPPPTPGPGVIELDDWYLRRGPHSRGPIHDAAWNAELDAAGRWLDALPVHGQIVELGAGTGWWAPLLAGKGELSLYEERPEALDRARDRLLAHRLRAHLHVRRAWDEPDRQVDALFTAFRLGRVAPERLPAFAALARRWLRSGGTLAFIERIADPHGGPEDDLLPGSGADREGDPQIASRVVPHDPATIRGALQRAGFIGVETTSTGRFFLLGNAVAG